MNKDKKNYLFGEKIKVSHAIAIGLIALIFLAGAFFLARTYRSFRHQGLFGPPYGENLRHRPLAVDNIEGWMTFGFVNRSFNLPVQYLKDALGVTDHKYPNITLDRWAKESSESSGNLLEEVKLLVRNYQNSGSSGNAPGAKNI